MRSMKSLRNNFVREGNATRKISKAERLHDCINYKNEISLSYERFSPSAKICTTYLKKKAIQRRRILKSVLSLNKLSTQTYINQLGH